MAITLVVSSSSPLESDNKGTKMEFRIIILSVACLLCLAPPAQGSLHALKAAAAVGALAIKGAIIKGAIEGAADKTASLLAAKAALVKATLDHFAGHKQPPAQPIIVEEPEPCVVVPDVVPANAVFVETSPPLRLPVSNSLASLLDSAHQATQHKINAVSNALASLHQPRPVPVPAPIFVESFRYPRPARFYPAPPPALHFIDDDCL